MTSIEKRSRDGRTVWRAHYRTPAGSQRNKTFSRKTDAERFLAGVEHAKATGAYVDPALAKVTVGDWASGWLAGQTHLKPSTFARYKGILRKQILPRWGSVALANVSHADVQAWVTSLSKEYSPATVQKVHNVLSLVLEMAVKDGRLSRNVVQGVNLPRVGRHEHLYLTHEQVEALANQCGFPDHPSRHATYDTRANASYRLVVLFLAYTGARFGEMAALKVARLDLRRGRAMIAESVTPIAGQGLVWGTPKNHQRREVPIPKFLVDELRDHVAGKRPDELVFASIRSDQPLRVSTFRQTFGVAASAIGMPGLHPHQLRHTAASLAIASGADVKVVQQMMGHSSATMTLDTYGHLFEDRLDEVAAAMDAARAGAQHRRHELRPLPRVARALPEPDLSENDEAAPPSVFAGQDRFSDVYPRPDSNRRYRLERAAC